MSAWPKHRVDIRGKFKILKNQDSAPINYLNHKPDIRNLEKEVTNNNIKIMNMKTDYFRMKKLMSKIHNKSGAKLLPPLRK